MCRTFLFHILSLSWSCSFGDLACKERHELADASSCEAAVGAELALTCQLDAGFRLILPDTNVDDLHVSGFLCEVVGKGAGTDRRQKRV
jgi:hypothetical protein